MKIIMVGGDKRQLRIKNNLEKLGHYVHHITSLDDLNIDFTLYDTVIFPLPTSRDGIYINNALGKDKIKITDITDNLETQKILCGNFVFEDFEFTDYAQDESTAILNAVPTAEGAIAIAIENTAFTVWKSKCLVVGNGKIGKALSERLKALLADVTVSARRDTDFSYIESRGIKYIKTDEIEKNADEYNIIFNTVPKQVLTKNVLKNCKSDCLLIELASSPYGIDFKAAEDLKLKVILALGLPGKYAPNTAADILTNSIVKNLNKETQKR